LFLWLTPKTSPLPFEDILPIKTIFMISCHSPHLAKIQGMKSISKPRLLIEIYTSLEFLSTDDFRKKPLFFFEKFPLPQDLSLPVE
jgi:hypothetical protein